MAVDCVPVVRGGSSLLSMADGTRTAYLAEVRVFPWPLRKYSGNTVP